MDSVGAASQEVMIRRLSELTDEEIEALCAEAPASWMAPRDSKGFFLESPSFPVKGSFKGDNGPYQG